MKGISHFLYIVKTACRDTFRARGALIANLLTLVGICLPVLLLLGLKRGLVQQFHDNINKSPTARQIELWATQEGTGLRFSRENCDRLKDSIGGLALIIPDVHGNGWASGTGGTEMTVNFACTEPGDPYLGFYGADVLKQGDRGVVVSRDVADQLGLEYEALGNHRYHPRANQQVTLRLQRSIDNNSATVTLPVAGVFSQDNSAGDPKPLSTIYLTYDMLDRFEDFKKGLSVAELNWPGAAVAPKVQYDGYLSFSKVPYDARDRDLLRGRGLTVLTLDEAPLDENPAEVRELYGLLKPHELHVSWLGIVYQGEGRREPVDLDPQSVEDVTDSDEVIIPWSTARSVMISGAPYRLVGVSARGRWLKKYFRDYDTKLSLGNAFQGMLVRHPVQAGTSANASPNTSSSTSSNTPAASDGSNPEPFPVIVDGQTFSLQAVPFAIPESPNERLATWEQRTAQRVAEWWQQRQQPLSAKMDPQHTYAVGRSLWLTGATAWTAPQGTQWASLQNGWTNEVQPAWQQWTSTFVTRHWGFVESATGPNYVASNDPPESVEPVGEQPAIAVAEQASTALMATKEETAAACLAFWRRPWAPGGVLRAMLPKPTEGLLVTSAELPAYLARQQSGGLEYDALIGQFVPRRISNEYTKALAYPVDLISVPDVDSKFRELGYSTTSSRTSVEEMRGYIHTLDILFFSILGSVALFGVFTVGAAFYDVTQRRRGAIGIARLLGMSRGDIVCFVLTRAISLGTLASMLALLVAIAVAWVLHAGFSVACHVSLFPDLFIVLSCTLACCLLGVILPTVVASRLNPVDAIQQSRLQ